MLKKTILQYKTKKNLKHRILEPNADFKSSKQIAIVYSDQLAGQNENINHLIKELEDEGKNVSVLIYCHSPQQINTSLPHFTSKDISTIGEIKNEHLTNFLKGKYDFALCLDKSNYFLIDYIFSMIKAKCRVGFMHPTRDNLFEMMVHVENTETALSSEVLRYLKMIQSI